MLALRAKWNKIGAGRNEQVVDVIVRGFAQASNSNTQETRPVAIVQDLSDKNRLRYVELKFLEVEGEIDVAG